MEMTVTGTLFGEAAELTWRDGVVSGTGLALTELLEAKGEVYANPQWPAVHDPDVTQHLDFVVTALAVLDPDARVEGDIPYVEPLPPGARA